MTGANVVKGDNVKKVLERALDAGEGLLRLTPNWVPRSFLHPGKRIRLHPDDYYAYGGQPRRHRRTLVRQHHRRRQRRPRVARRAELLLVRGPAVPAEGRRGRRPARGVIGKKLWETVPALARLLEVLRQHGPDPAPHAPEVRARQADRPGRQARSATTSRRSTTTATTISPTRSSGLEPGTTKAQVRKCLEDWNKGDNGILDLSKAYRLKRGTGWLVPPGVLHAPGSLCTYEPQWGSDVFGMYQSLVEGREVPWSLLVKDVPEGQAPGPGLHRRAARLGKERRSELQGQQLPGADRRPTRATGWVDRWIVYGLVDGKQLFRPRN